MAKQASNASTETLLLDAVDNQGRTGRIKLSATIIGPEVLEEKRRIKKSEGGTDVPQSQARDEDEWVSLLYAKNRLIEPPYELQTLSMMREQSTELGQCIQAMVTNTVGFGYQVKEKAIPDKMRKLLEPEIDAEKHMLEAKLSTVHPTKSLTHLRSNDMWDKQACGNGYLELIDNQRGDLVGMNHIPGHSIRVTQKQKSPCRIYVPRVRPDMGYKIEEVLMWHRFRRYAQVTSISRNRQVRSSNTLGGVGRLVWFKQAGDTRQMDKRDGRYAKRGEIIPFRYRSTSLIHDSLYNPTGPYGVPHYIGNIFSILGSRGADEINFNTINSNAIPSMIITVENGNLTEGSIQRLQEFTESQIQRSQNYSKFLLIEGETIEDGSPNPAAFRIKIEPLTRVQHDDQLFQIYDNNNRDKIRQSYRLPPIFVGRCHSEDTEYLTNKGWRKYSEVEESDTLATMNSETSEIEYQSPTGRHSYAYDGDLLHMKNRGVDALVTPNHRMCTRPTVTTGRSEKSWELVEASELQDFKGGIGGYIEFPVAVNWQGERLESFEIPSNADTSCLLHPHKHIEKVPYTGKVSCFTVPNGLLVTRRNGRVLISGNSDDYTRATADTSRDIADEQVFSPERDQADYHMNRFVLPRWDARFHKLQSNTPNITDDIELVRLMAIAEKSGGMTPRLAARIVRDVFGADIGPLPTGIDLDRPYSMQFAEGQKDGAGGPNVADNLARNLTDLSFQIEKELERRMLLPTAA